VRMSRLLAGLTIVLAPLVLSSSASAAGDQPPGLSQQPDPSDPISVVEEFLSARNARDAFGATYFIGPTVLIQDADAKWLADEPSARQWLGRLMDTYVIDMLVRPHTVGGTVVWVERLSSRSIPFPDALRDSLAVEVEVVVQDGKITSYSAQYPMLRLPPSGVAMQSSNSGQRTNATGIPPALLFVASALALIASLFVSTRATHALSRDRHSI